MKWKSRFYEKARYIWMQITMDNNLKYKSYLFRNNIKERKGINSKRTIEKSVGLKLSKDRNRVKEGKEKEYMKKDSDGDEKKIRTLQFQENYSS